MVLNNGTYGNVQILQPSTVDLIFHNFNTNFPGDEHGLGFELDQYYWSGPMASLECAGHTGYTGTTMAIDRGGWCQNPGRRITDDWNSEQHVFHSSY